MEILTVTLFLTVAVFLHSIEISHAWLRKGNSTVNPEPVLPIRIRGYLDENNAEHLLQVESRVTLGIRKLGRVDYIVGVVRDERVRPMIDYDGDKLMINMVESSGFLISNHEYDHLFGVAPQHTVEGIIAPPLLPQPEPLQEEQQPPGHPPPDHHHHHR